MKKYIAKFNNKLNAKGGVLKSVSLLMGGIVFAHAITILLLPLITRLYSPEDFSKLAVYSSLLGILSVIACLRFEIAIPLPKSDDIAEQLLSISIFCAIIFSLILASMLFIFSTSIESIMGNAYFSEILWLLPLGVLSASLYSAFKFWFTRIKDFKAVAQTKIQQSISSNSAQLLLGWLGYTSIGLLIGQLLYSGAGVFSLIRKKGIFKNLNYNALKETAIEYKHYPKYSVGEALFNTASSNLPMLIIAALAVPKEAGYLLLASKIMIIPMVLIGDSVSQVYYAYAIDAESEGRLAEFTNETMKKLALIGCAPLLFIGIVAPVTFPLLFGPDWGRAGTLVAWMTPWFILQLVISPVSIGLHIKNHQRYALMLQFFGLILNLSLMYLVSFNYSEYLTETYAVSSFLFYIMYFGVLKKSLNIENIYKIFINKYIFISVTLTSIFGFIITQIFSDLIT